MKKLFIFIFLITFLFIPKFAQADSIILSPSDFQPISDTQQYLIGPYYMYAVSGPLPMSFCAPVHLPDGAKLTSVVVFYYDMDSSGELGIEFLKVNAYTNDVVGLGFWTSSGTSGGFNSHKISPILVGNTVNNSGYTYSIHIYFTSTTAGPDVKLYKVKINYK
jgi:hypothetical protein